MNNYLKQQLNKLHNPSQRKLLIVYISISLLIAIYRRIFMWRISISDYYYDEIDWSYVAGSSSLIKNIFVLDGSYFVPLCRAIFWLAFQYSTVPALILHILSCLIVGLCCSSLILFKNVNLNLTKKIIISLCLGCYQSFDLLLWMNINYYLFIVCFFVLLNQLFKNKKNINNFEKTFLIILFVNLGKPQLILCCLLLIILTLILSNLGISLITKFELLSITILASSFLVSRLTPGHLDLSFGLSNVAYALLGLLKLPFVIITPVLAIGNAKISTMLDSPTYNVITNIFIVVFSILTYRVLLTKKILERQYLNYTLFGIFPLYVSLFVFHNTGWATSFFWNNSCISCMSSRHLFPVYFLAIMILQLFVKTRFILTLLLQILFLNVIYALSSQIF